MKGYAGLGMIALQQVDNWFLTFTGFIAIKFNSKTITDWGNPLWYYEKPLIELLLPFNYFNLYSFILHVIDHIHIYSYGNRSHSYTLIFNFRFFW
jgi:hypothetical protein